MTGIWVDTDFGFDDLWAMLVLRAEDIDIAGVSLVAGNTPLPQVKRNACGARLAIGAAWPLFEGADAPLMRDQETAERILGPRGMQSRGRHLPDVPEQTLPLCAPAMRKWLSNGQQNHDVLALGPLTNLAQLYQQAPQEFRQIKRIVWMGGSSGRGNHSPHAEFNALADPEAAAVVIASGVPVDIVDLEICRKVVFGPMDVPSDLTPLLTDLLLGYLDIALSRGRDRMVIYDPLAALAIARPGSVTFAQRQLEIDTSPTATYGKTRFGTIGQGPVSLARSARPDAMLRCLNALRKVSE